MNSLSGKFNNDEYLKITKMILKGNTIAQIARTMNYSESTVSNRIYDLMQEYRAQNRFEFINNFFSRIIQKYKIKLKLVQKENLKLKKELQNTVNKFPIKTY